MSNGNTIDSTVFSANFTETPFNLDVYSLDAAKAGYYDFIIKAFYDIQPTVEVTATFNIELKLCTQNTLDINSGIWTN